MNSLPSATGVSLNGEEIDQLLADADSAARDEGPELVKQYEAWLPRIERLSEDECPARTYLAVLAVLLGARALYPLSRLDVLSIQKGGSPRGYSASSIAGKLVPFAVHQQVDLRTKSSQVMNSQPFCFKKQILPTIKEMNGKERWASHWNAFFELALLVQEMNTDEARGVLALVFFVRRQKVRPAPVARIEGGRPAWVVLVRELAKFVDENVDGGRVGQALVAAGFDVVHGQNQVSAVKINDPSFSEPGDVAVSCNDTIWQWCEVKQKLVQADAIVNFATTVVDVGGDRVVYCALSNHRYSTPLKEKLIQRCESERGISILVHDSPRSFLDFVEKAAPMSYYRLNSLMADRMAFRLQEQGCVDNTLRAFDEVLSRVGRDVNSDSQVDSQVGGC